MTLLSLHNVLYVATLDFCVAYFGILPRVDGYTVQVQFYR